MSSDELPLASEVTSFPGGSAAVHPVGPAQSPVQGVGVDSPRLEVNLLHLAREAYFRLMND